MRSTSYHFKRISLATSYVFFAPFGSWLKHLKLFGAHLVLKALVRRLFWQHYFSSRSTIQGLEGVLKILCTKTTKSQQRTPKLLINIRALRAIDNRDITEAIWWDAEVNEAVQ